MIALLQSCSIEDNPAPPTEPEPAKTFATLKEALQSMNNVVKIEANAPKELTGKYKEVYELRFRQPVDHKNPGQKTFEQLVIAELINSGDFERHINRVRRNKRRELIRTVIA